MKRPLLSICIPTYNRGNILYKNLLKIIQFESNEIEIVINDNYSTDSTESLVKSIKDPRIKYYRNKSNLGYDRNVLNGFLRCSGNFIFFLSDEDMIHFPNLPWLLIKIQNIDQNKENISLILGKIMDIRFFQRRKRFTQIKDNFQYADIQNRRVYYNPGDKIYPLGPKTLSLLLFQNLYLSGLIIRKNEIDLSEAKQYIGSSYIQLFLKAFSIMNGKTVCTSKIMCEIGNQSKRLILDYSNKKNASKMQKITYQHPYSRIKQFISRKGMITKFINREPKLYLNMLRSEFKKSTFILLVSCYKLYNDVPKAFLAYLKYSPKIFKLYPNQSKLDFWISIIQAIKYIFQKKMQLI